MVIYVVVVDIGRVARKKGEKKERLGFKVKMAESFGEYKMKIKTNKHLSTYRENDLQGRDRGYGDQPCILDGE